ncbi:CLUMA_CG010837, isoform A [Clunio marinus]|uniref:CLUMA_CG010837, isoform A n=1 Tax=Clunio marinus TaxID=568069 RepID=A0A1J1IB42_9DIPT|nr:CLUMA_CG010837, isoform A [Clunio marinus]
MTSSDEFLETYEEFRKIYQECSNLIGSGIELEIQDENKALEKYKEAITLIDKAMATSISMPSNDNVEESSNIETKMKDLKKMIYNFKMQRSEILLRIGTIYRKKEDEVESLKRKTSVESLESSGNTSKRRARTYEELEKVLKELGKVQSADKETNNPIEILFCCNGVKLYYIESNGEVVSSLEDTALRIVKLGCDFDKNLDETIFLQLIKTSDSSIDIGHEISENQQTEEEINEAVGGVESHVDPSFIYPLIPDVSPCFPQKTGEFIDYSTPYIIAKMQKAPENAPPVSEKVQTGVVVAKSLTGYAAQGTSFVAEKVGSAMTRFGQFLAPHVQQQGSKLLTYTVGMEESKATETMTETLKIASGTADAISTIYNGLQSSAGILGQNLADNTVKIVEHKYGQPMGAVTSNTFDTVGNLYNVNRNFNIMTPKGLVKSTAKSAGKGILQSDAFKPKVYLNKNYFTGSVSLYPNLDNFARELNKPKFGQI